MTWILCDQRRNGAVQIAVNSDMVRFFRPLYVGNNQTDLIAVLGLEDTPVQGEPTVCSCEDEDGAILAMHDLVRRIAAGNTVVMSNTLDGAISPLDPSKVSAVLNDGDSIHVTTFHHGAGAVSHHDIGPCGRDMCPVHPNYEMDEYGQCVKCEMGG